MTALKVLLVDDEKAFTQTTAKLLESRGYKVTAVNSGIAAVSSLEGNHYDVMILDLKMPEMDGMTTLKEIKKLGSLPETLILTAHGAIDTAFEAVNLGAHDYLSKPCDIDELAEKIEEAAKKKSDGQRQSPGRNGVISSEPRISFFRLRPNNKSKQRK